MRKQFAKTSALAVTGFALAGAALSSQAWALNNIVRPYQSVRSSGMGSVRLTTGFYEENFFGNPARVTENPIWRLTLLDVSAEVNTNIMSHVDDLTGGGDTLTKVANTAGESMHGRVQTAMPALYLPHLGRMSYAFGVVTSTQADVSLRRSYQLEPNVFADVGPAFTVGRKFLEDERLSIGATAHATYRISTRQNYSFVDLIQGKSLGAGQSGGDGAHLDFDLGGTYIFTHTRPLGFELQAGAAINNVLGGTYRNLGVHILSSKQPPREQPRTYGLGISATRPEILFLDDTTFAFEITDIGNNSNGSMFKTFHLGGETHWKFIALRAGINQGYLAGGVGLNFFKILEIDAATYGEEMGLNVGSKEDRRYALRVALHI